MEKAPEMIYRHLGNTGIKVSVLGFGTWLNYHDLSESSEKSLEDCIRVALNSGINFLDTAEMYGEGAAEELLGQCLQRIKPRRSDIVVQTKLFKYKPGVNSNYLSRKHIIEGMQGSLQRLKLDYVDIVLCHRYDDYTPIEEVCRGMNYLIESGQTFYWGTSQWSAAEIMEAFDCCDRLDLIKPIADQPQYSMLLRKDVEYKLAKLFSVHKYGTTVFAPLGGGLLTGKYNAGMAPENSRFAKVVRSSDCWTQFVKSEKREDTLKKLNALGELSKKHDCSQSDLALAWVVQNTDVACAVFGATKPEQVQANLGCLKVCRKWTPEIEQEVEKILQNQPKPHMDWRKWGPGVPRRSQTVSYSGY